MGNHDTERWRRTGARPDTDAALALDVRLLARHGYLRPGAHEVRWSRGEVPAGSIVLRVAGESPPAVVLDYQIEGAGIPPRAIRERVAITRTACHYGGERPWFLCPACGRRRAVLYALDGLFRCRACHGVAYASTRETVMRRMLRRAEAVQAKLGGRSGGSVYDPPPRPKGMHRRTYDRLCEELGACQLAAITATLGGVGWAAPRRAAQRG